MGAAGKIIRAFREGTLLRKVAPYLWLCTGLSFIVRAWCLAKKTVPGKIVFNNFHGRGFGDHQKYIALELIRRKVPVEMVWLSADAEMVRKTLPSGIRPVKIGRFMPLRALCEMATAQFWCSNQSFTEFSAWGLSKKRSQTYINTHHGSLGIKCIGSDIPSARSIPLRTYVLKRDASMIDYLVSNAVWEAEFVYRRRFMGFGKAELFGHPRNDILINECRAVRRKVTDELGLPEDARILFYAPTYRASSCSAVYLGGFARLLAACEKRLGGRWRAVVRLHPIMRRSDFCFDDDIVDATDYPDIQELMSAADALISDYSSCMFDFMLTRRPVFVYAPDIEEYQKVQGFYYPMSETPFPVAMTEQELIENINAFDAVKYKAEVEAFLEDKGCVEDGHATERTVDLIERLMK